MKYYLSLLSIAFIISCDPEQEVDFADPEESIDEKISALLADLDPAPTYSYSKENQEIPPCRLIQSRFTASYETSEVVKNFIYEGDLLSKVETYYDGEYADTKYIVRDKNIMKVISSDSVVIDKYLFEKGLLAEYYQYSHGEEKLNARLYYFNNLPNRLLFVNDSNEISVIDLISDTYGNVLEERVIWIEDKFPLNSYLYKYSYNEKIQPFYNLPQYWNNRNLNSINNKIEFNAFIDGVLQVDDEVRTFEYDLNGFLIKRIEDSGFTHTNEYTYECE